MNSQLRPKKLTLMVLVGAHTTFPARTNFFLFPKKYSKKNSKIFFQKIKIQKKN